MSSFIKEAKRRAVVYRMYCDLFLKELVRKTRLNMDIMFSPNNVLNFTFNLFNTSERALHVSNCINYLRKFCDKVKETVRKEFRNIDEILILGKTVNCEHYIDTFYVALRTNPQNFIDKYYLLVKNEYSKYVSIFMLRFIKSIEELFFDIKIKILLFLYFVYLEIFVNDFLYKKKFYNNKEV